MQVLRGVGLWPAIAPDAEPMTDIRITDGEAPVFLHYDHREVAEEAFGYAPRRMIATDLHENLLSQQIVGLQCAAPSPRDLLPRHLPFAPRLALT